MKKIFYLILPLGLFTSCMQDKSTDLKEAKSKERIQQFYDQLVNPHNVDMVDSFFTSDFVDHQLEPEKSKIGAEGVKAAFKNDFFTSFPDAHLKVHFMLASGDTVMAKVTMTGTNTGLLNGKPATNKSINFDGIAVFVLRDNKIAERWRFFNDVLMMQQLGMMPGQDDGNTSKR